MPLLMTFLSNSVAVCVACLIFWRFGPQRVHWHVLALLISVLAGVALGFEWKSAASQITFNSADTVLLVWGAFGLTSRSRWQTRSRGV